MPTLELLAQASQRVAESSRRTVKVHELASCLQGLSETEIETGVMYLSGDLPQGKIGVGPAVVHAASATGPASTPTLTITRVDQALTTIGAIKGAGSTTRRKQALEELFSNATAIEQHFLVRLLTGELRQGALAGVMVEAIATAAALPLPEIRRAAMYANHLGSVARAALHEGSAALQRYRLQTLSPIAPMLAETASDVADALRQLGEAAVFEWKVDGARVQVHKRSDEVRVFTRSLNDVTGAVPEVVEVARNLNVTEIVLDGETVALDREQKPLPFQITMRRFGRKGDIDSLRAELPLHVYFFDCLKLNGEDLADRPASDRHLALTRHVPEQFRVPQIARPTLAKAEAFYAAALAAGHEGVMAKSLDAPYEAGKRGASWLKIKRAHARSCRVGCGMGAWSTCR